MKKILLLLILIFPVFMLAESNAKKYYLNKRLIFCSNFLNVCCFSSRIL